jgi:hypothetical protein
MVLMHTSGVEHVSECRQARPLARLMMILVVAIFSTSAYANLPHLLGLKALVKYVPPFDGRDSSFLGDLGGEHRSIATALCQGRGFADPFHEPTGTTAWMPPVLPAIEAALLALGGSVFAVVTITLLQNVSLAFTGWLVLTTAGRCQWPQAPAVSLALFLLSTWSVFTSSYQVTQDIWLIMLLVGVMVYLADRLGASPFGPSTAAGWGLLGGIATLSSPVLGSVWLALCVVLARSTRRFRPFIFSILVATTVVMPWIVRNAIVFGRFIPVKSNLPFELYQSNVLEPDGVLRNETLNKHPFRSAEPERRRYKELGEMAYLDDYRANALKAIRRDPMGYLDKVKNRFLAATILYPWFFEGEGKGRVFVRSLIYPWPFLGLLAVVLSSAWTRNRLIVIALVVYVAYLSPYVMVSYYRRYAVPLLGLQVMFLIWGLDVIRAQWIERFGSVMHSSGSGVSPVKMCSSAPKYREVESHFG